MEKVVFRQKRAEDLIKMGNKLLRIEVCKNQPCINVYIFKNTKKLQNDFTELANKYKK